MYRFRFAGTLVGLGALLVSCSTNSSTTSSSAGTSNGSTTSVQHERKIGGSVRVAYAGSLVGAFVENIAPAFVRETGVGFSGLPGGSSGLANEIKSKTIAVDVFISASPSVNDLLMGAPNGSWESWYALLGNSPLVVGYNPRSQFAKDLRTKPWYQVMQMPGFLLGRTDPQIDPKGVLVEKLITQESSKISDPSLENKVLGSPENPSQIFPEETLVARLQSGQLDAGFFYSSEASLAHIPSVSTGISLGATFTVTILNSSQDRTQALAFVNFLYSPQGRQLLKISGVTTTKPSIFGNVHSAPSGLSL